MVKIATAILILVLCYGTLSSEAGEIVLKITNIKETRQSLQIDYSVTNNTDNSIWVCNDADDKSRIDYEINFDEKAKKVTFRIASIKVPQNVLLEEPIWAKYKKLLPQKTINKSISQSIPLTEIKAFKTKRDVTKKIVESAATVILEVGMYKMNLETNKSDCCREDSDGQIMFVDCFWSEKNKEQIVASQEVNYRVPVTVER